MNSKEVNSNRRLIKRSGVLFLLALSVLVGWWWLGANDKPTQPEPGALDVWTTWGDSSEELQTLLDAYSVDKDLSINVSNRLRLEDLQDRLQSGEAPDLIILSSADPVSAFVENGWVEPLNGRIQGELGWCITQDGLPMCVPLGFDVPTFYWNRDLFAQAGLDPSTPPANFDELFDYARKLTVRDDNGQLVQAGFIPDFPAPHPGLYALASPNRPIGDINTALVTNQQLGGEPNDWLDQFNELYSPEEINDFVDSFTKYRSSSHPVFSGRRLSCQQCHRTTDLKSKKIPALGLTTGNVAMMIEGSWELWLGGLADRSNIGAAPVPGVVIDESGGNQALFDGPVVVIPAAAMDKQEALELVGWLMTPEIQANAAQTFSLISSRAIAPGAGNGYFPDEIEPAVGTATGY